MRLSSIAIAVALLPACRGKEDKEPTAPAPSAADTKVTEAAPPVKKHVDTTPLPPLAADPGGATGKPAWATGFGGLGIDSPRDVAVAQDGSIYVAGLFDGEIDFGGTIGKHVAPSEKPKDAKSDAYLVK